MVTRKNPAPAEREYCVWADCNRRVYQDVSASSPEQAYRIARKHPEDWQFCFEHEANGYRLSDDVQDVAAGEFLRVGPAPRHCKTCDSEIVETVNDSLFRDGECNGCEYERYASQPKLLRACAAVARELESVSSAIPHGTAARRRCRRIGKRLMAAIAKARTTMA